jgi:multicomponent Na+:H+ antiporter subunit D
MPELLAQAPWMVWAIALPLGGALLAFLSRVMRRRRAGHGLPDRRLRRVGVLVQVAFGGARRYLVGGWGAPLGSTCFADGLSALMLAMTAVVGTAVSIYARVYLATSPTRCAASGRCGCFCGPR